MMRTFDLAQQRVLILGLGDSGLAMARWCQASGAEVSAWDSRADAPADARFIDSFGDAARLRGALHPGELVEQFDLIGISPGLAPHHEPVAGLVRAAQQRGLLVCGEFEFFAQELQRQSGLGYRPQVVAITGTNGKTTVTSLVGQLVRSTKRSVRVAGNIGPAVLDALLDAKRTNTLPDIWVLEVSSFQLETTESFAPSAAALLNLSQDHLDWHGDLNAYLAAKLRIFTHAQVRVINRDDPNVLAGESSFPTAIAFDRISYGLSVPTVAGDFGVLEEAGMRWLVVADPLDEAQPVRRHQKKLIETDYRVVRLMPAEALLIRGDHNVSNALAALALCRAIQLPLAPVLRALAQYRGEPHRVEVVGQLNGIDFIDDSKGTNVGATVAALNGLGQRVVLIAGGVGKEQDFSPLAAPIARHARGVILIGRDREQVRLAIGAAAQRAGVVLADAQTLPEAVQAAFALAQPGDAVLLSPACASLDMFRNYIHRADVFVESVRELMMEAGQPC